MYGTCVFVRDAIILIHVKRYSYTFESQKEVACTTHLWNPKKERRERLRRRNQYDRYRYAAESAQQSGNDGMVNGWISKRMQLQLTRVTCAACSAS